MNQLVACKAKKQSLNHSDGRKSGWVGIFYKDSHPLKIHVYLSFKECVVCQFNFGKKVIFPCFYRNPEYKANSKDLQDVLINFECNHVQLRKENPYATFYTGLVNWLPSVDTNWMSN